MSFNSQKKNQQNRFISASNSFLGKKTMRLRTGGTREDKGDKKDNVGRADGGSVE
ncbi:MAG: hypothetical protein LBJ00_15680 [Planctomycetaceae bacterium]|jgi:hypothetical protein|nr:hypothetical protein [Planctomycetaceae bacterium]